MSTVPFLGIRIKPTSTTTRALIHSFPLVREKSVGRVRKAPLKEVKINHLIKGLRKGLSIYALNLNKPEKETEG